MAQDTYLITGSMGCIGAWVLHHLVKSGRHVVSFDLSTNRSRLDLLLTKDEQENIHFIQGDLTDYEAVKAVFDAQNVTHVIHLAALQVPFCRANPVVGAQVNVVGTVNVFEAAKQSGLKHLAYASSIAVYGTPDEYPAGAIAHDAPNKPHTLYGVYKVANEGTARVYWQDHQISSTALRPYTVYGIGRDQGLTSEPTKAMLAAAAGKDYNITFGGKMLFHYASDVALQFIEAAEKPLDGAYVFNLGGDSLDVSEVVAMINRAKPGVNITNDDRTLPFPEDFDGSVHKQHLGSVNETPVEDGVKETIAQFERLIAEGKLAVEE